MNQLLKKFPDEVAQILAKYPSELKQSAIMPLLHLAQRESSFVSRTAVQEISEITGATSTEINSVIGFYTLFHVAGESKIRIQVCTDVACDLRGAREYVASLCEQLGIKHGQTTSDGLIMIEEVKCLAACDKAPMFQAQIGGEIEYHENQTPARTIDWLRSMSSALTGNPLKTNTPATDHKERGSADGVNHE